MKKPRLIPSVEGVKEFVLPIDILWKIGPFTRPTIPELSDFLDDLDWFNKNKARLNYDVYTIERWNEGDYVARVEWKLVSRDRVRRDRFGNETSLIAIDEVTFFDRMGGRIN